LTAAEDPRDEKSEETADAMIMAPRLLESSSPGVARARKLGTFVVLDKPVVSADEAFKLLRIDRVTGYKSIREGTFPLPVIRIGRIIRIPTAALVRLLNPQPKSDSELPRDERS
jgi:hypothetical protein